VRNRGNLQPNLIKLNDYDEIIPGNKMKGAGQLIIPQQKDVYYVDDFMEKRDKPMEATEASHEPPVLDWQNMDKKGGWPLAILSSLLMIALTLGLFFVF
jgi:hypothetical protein